MTKKEGFIPLFYFFVIFIGMETKKITELILENVENLLLEGRVENIKKKYPQPTWEYIDKLVEADPSKTNKFLEWSTKMLLPQTIKYIKDLANRGGYYGPRPEEVPDTAEDPNWVNGSYNLRRSLGSISDSTVSDLKDNLEHFFKNPSKYEIKDINQFKTMKEFEDAVEKAKQKLSRKEQKETGVDKVFEDDRFILMMPKTHKASCRYGARTRWCVTMRGYSGYFENYFSQGPIFFLVDKSQPERSYRPSYMQEAENYWKIAIHYRPFNGRLDQSGQRALEYARSMDKEAFVDGANVGNTHIDYWNVQDENKKESVVAKYLGGPGRGQSQRAEVILNQLKSVMERYTKKILSDYYDSLGDSTQDVDKLNALKDKVSKLNNEARNMYYKLDRLGSAKYQLGYFRDRLDTEEGSDDEYREWVEEQIRKSDEFYNQIENKRSEILQEVSELEDKIDDIKNKLSDKRLVFYDKEKNVPMSR